MRFASLSGTEIVLYSLIAAVLSLSALPAMGDPLQPPFLVTLGAIECEFTRSHLDVLKWRDLFVIGDPHSDPRPAAQVLLLTKDWKQLAQPTDEDSNEPVVNITENALTVQLSGIMREFADGPGRWLWQQTWTIKREGKLHLSYRLEQLAKPDKVWWLHRVSLIGNRTELFVEYPNKDKHTPGKHIPILTQDGQQFTPRFGGEGNHVEHPAEIRLPHSGHNVILRFDKEVSRVELWNAWWRQAVNIGLPVQEIVSTSLEIDLTDLPQVADPQLTISSISPDPSPWITGDIPELPPVKHPLRFAQGTPSIIAHSEVRGRDADELRRFFAEMEPHFDIMELPVAWTDWKWDLNWAENDKAREHAEKVAAEVRKQVQIAHEHGIKLAVSLNFGSSGPGTGNLETRRQPRFQGEVFDVETGQFVKNRDFYDWGSQEAVAQARQSWEDCARLIGSVDYMFLNEPHWRTTMWHEMPMFSTAALRDFREFVGDPQARFPAKPYAPDTERTDNKAGPDDWNRWYDWLEFCLARMIRIEAEAFDAANADNPDYGGTIYFQNVNWTGRKWAVDLNRIAAIPEVTWLCAEYVTQPDHPLWRKFKYFATRHGKNLSSFVNAGQYDPDKPGRVRYEGSDEGFEAAVRMGVEEGAGMITLYPATSLDSGSEAYHPKRTAIWDSLTAPR